jgi:hypothetical protein
MSQFLELDRLLELKNKQLDNIKSDRKISVNDLRRLIKYTETSFFDENECCLWNGYITNLNYKSKGEYVNFYFKKHKTSLHRLLYENFKEPLSNEEYIKYTCQNKGKCCNLNHMIKYKYNFEIPKEVNIKKEEKRDLVVEDNFKLVIYVN